MNNCFVLLLGVFGRCLGQVWSNRGLEDTAQLGASWPVLFTQYYSSDQNWKNEIGGECIMYSGRGVVLTGF